jgi:hypothetical protein
MGPFSIAMLNYQRITIPKSSLCKNVLIQTIPMVVFLHVVATEILGFFCPAGGMVITSKFGMLIHPAVHPIF